MPELTRDDDDDFTLVNGTIEDTTLLAVGTSTTDISRSGIERNRFDKLSVLDMYSSIQHKDAVTDHITGTKITSIGTLASSETDVSQPRNIKSENKDKDHFSSTESHWSNDYNQEKAVDSKFKENTEKPLPLPLPLESRQCRISESDAETPGLQPNSAAQGDLENNQTILSESLNHLPQQRLEHSIPESSQRNDEVAHQNCIRYCYDSQLILNSSDHPLQEQQSTTNSQTHLHTVYQDGQQNQIHHRQNHMLDHHTRSHQQQRELLLQSSDDPLIGRGANSVIVDDDHAIEFKSLLIPSIQNGSNQRETSRKDQSIECHLKRKTQQRQKLTSNAFHNNLETVQTRKYCLAQTSLVKRPQNGCSSLTKQQLKVKAFLMSAAAKQKEQQQEIQTQKQSLMQDHRQESLSKEKTFEDLESAASVRRVTRPTKPKKKSPCTHGNLKLRFHHQALPAEYLSHYESIQAGPQRNQQDRRGPKLHCNTTTSAENNKSIGRQSNLPDKKSHDNVRSWLKKIADIQQSAQENKQQQPNIGLTSDNEHRINFALPTHDDNYNNQKVLRTGTGNERVYAKPTADLLARNSSLNSTNVRSCAKRTMTYADLPYMGEITLNNSKPRRGRKPKKADICHLIYKNYGTLLTAGAAGSAAGAESKEKFTGTACEPVSAFLDALHEHEPLNLCLRDQQSINWYTIPSDNSTDEVSENDAADEKADASNYCERERVGITEFNHSTSQSSHQKSAPHEAQQAVDDNAKPSENRGSETAKLLLQPVDLYYKKLFGAGIRERNATLSERQTPLNSLAGLPIETIKKDNQLALKISIPNGLLLKSKQEVKLTNAAVATTALKSPQLVKQQISQYPEQTPTPSSAKSENSSSTSSSKLSSQTNFGSSLISGANSGLPQKRKRSAIFIPPMPAENTANPPTEVSICKFKFTGGVKPTLQEKKMLSVDADGNYRYYSGTGDKSMRGYEFFPRESLQQSGFLPGVSSPVAFLNATGEKLATDIPPPSAGLSNEILQIPDSPNSSLLPSSSTTAPGGSSILVNALNNHGAHPCNRTAHSPSTGSSPTQSHNGNLFYETSPQAPSEVSSSVSQQQAHQPNGSENHNYQSHRKKKTVSGSSPASPPIGSTSALSSRRAVQREKLEKTFKEKGFLIQTQKLESAEGATYCKFRQLKKFTRYLFRNWKDYLPDDDLTNTVVDSSDANHERTTSNPYNTASERSPMTNGAFDDCLKNTGVKKMPPFHETKAVSNLDFKSEPFLEGIKRREQPLRHTM